MFLESKWVKLGNNLQIFEYVTFPGLKSIYYFLGLTSFFQCTISKKTKENMSSV